MPVADAANAAPNTFDGCTPIFRVESVRLSIEYYINVLGFKLDWEDGGIFASVTRGRCGIFLSEGDQGHRGSWGWIGVSSADSLEAEYRKTGARIRHPPTNYRWAYEMQVEDLDGNVLRFGSDPKGDQPYGEWLDMYGRVWPMNPEEQRTAGCE